ncbi:hypothetical protein GCM10011374_39910 [Kocuria dechangensis]|uniref:AAA domain-containing protein n=1 Tax=Kocuria dechangensis TaxID=1176249 RepID=A0A917H9A0_9MICC|nr:AAA family ATPase [Kocuria dechangensis]GGG71250.1 hypothetical protein GCM10011374_39910 [Kocuria dechangensis]
MSRFLLVTPDTAYDRRFRAAVEGRIPGDVQTVFNASLPGTPDELLGRSIGEVPSVVLLGPGVAVEDALSLGAVFDVQRPEVSLVLVGPDDPALALAAMRAGFRDVVAVTADEVTLRVVLTRATDAADSRRRALPGAGASSAGTYANGHSSSRPDSRVIVVTSPKGGVGKTTLAANLAVGLGSIAPMNTIIVDLDVQFGDVAAALRLAPEHNLTDATTGPASQDALVLKTFLSVHPASIYALCTPSNPIEGERINAAQVTHLLDQLTGQFQYIVVDTAPGMGEHSLAALESATDVVFVTGMDVPGVRGMRKQMDLLNELGLVPQEVKVVVNAADRNNGLSVQDIEATIKHHVDLVIPRSKMAGYATNRGEPLLLHSPKDKASKKLRELVGMFDPDYTAPRKGNHRKAVGA